MFFGGLDLREGNIIRIAKGLYTIVSYITTMEQTTIQISKDLLNQLKLRKMNEKESYEQIIWDLMEDATELSEETKEAIAEGRRQFKEGRVHKWSDIKRDLRLNV